MLTGLRSLEDRPTDGSTEVVQIRSIKNICSSLNRSVSSGTCSKAWNRVGLLASMVSVQEFQEAKDRGHGGAPCASVRFRGVSRITSDMTDEERRIHFGEGSWRVRFASLVSATDRCDLHMIQIYVLTPISSRAFFALTLPSTAHFRNLQSATQYSPSVSLCLDFSLLLIFQELLSSFTGFVGFHRIVVSSRSVQVAIPSAPFLTCRHTPNHSQDLQHDHCACVPHSVWLYCAWKNFFEMNPFSSPTGENLRRSPQSLSVPLLQLYLTVRCVRGRAGHENVMLPGQRIDE